MGSIARFLDNDSVFGRICGLLGTIIAVNLLFVVSLLPVVTAGAGLCALYYCMLKLVRYREISPFAEFWKGFRDNFKNATIAEFALLALGVFLWCDIRICSYMSGMLRCCVTVVYGAAIALAVIAMYLFPVMSAFSGNLRTVVKCSVYFAGSNPVGTVLIAAINVIPVFMTYINPQMLPLAAFLWCMGGFAVTALCSSSIMMRRFGRYLEPSGKEPDKPDRKKILEEMKKLEG